MLGARPPWERVGTAGTPSPVPPPEAGLGAAGLGVPPEEEVRVCRETR